MRLGKLEIISAKKADEIIKVADEIYEVLNKQAQCKEIILSEIKRLKKESWDKNGFDRLYKLVKETYVGDGNGKTV